MAEYLIEEFQEIIPGVIIIVQPSGVRYKNTNATNKDITMSDWLDQNLKNSESRNRSSMHMYGYALIPYDTVNDIDFESYKTKVLEIFRGEMYKVEMFFMEGSYLYFDEAMKEEMLTHYTYGKIDDTRLLRIVKSAKESGIMKMEDIQLGSELVDFVYADTELNEGFNEFKFRYSGEEINHE